MNNSVSYTHLSSRSSSAAAGVIMQGVMARANTERNHFSNSNARHGADERLKKVSTGKVWLVGAGPGDAGL